MVLRAGGVEASTLASSLRTGHGSMAIDAFPFAAGGADSRTVALRGFEEGDMATDGRAGLQSRNATCRRCSTTLGMRAPRVQSGHARSHTIGLRVAISEDGALKGKGGRGERGS